MDLFWKCLVVIERPHLSFEEELNKCRGMMLNTAWRVLHNQEDAEEAVQEAALKAWANLDRFDRRSSFKTWIYRITFNAAQDMLRRKSRRPVAISLGTDDFDLNMLPSNCIGPDVEVCAKHDAGIIMSSLGEELSEFVSEYVESSGDKQRPRFSGDERIRFLRARQMICNSFDQHQFI